jgi:hypothetical protein
MGGAVLEGASILADYDRGRTPNLAAASDAYYPPAPRRIAAKCGAQGPLLVCIMPNPSDFAHRLIPTRL